MAAVVERERVGAAAHRELPVRERRADSGFWGYITTCDHKRVGMMYLTLGLVGLAIGGIFAMLIRLQLAVPDNHLLTGEAYNRVLTMHGTTMVFLAATPIAWGFMNYFVPIILGARDVAYPRLNAVSFWIALAGFIILEGSWIYGTPPDAGWFDYTPLANKDFSPGPGVDAYCVGVFLNLLSSALGSLNMLVTYARMRAPGMSLMKMPPVAWFWLASIVLFFTAGVPLMVDVVYLELGRWFGANFFTPANGGDPVLWMTTFWLFGHPEVYLLLLPALGPAAEIIATFARKPFFGYGSMIAGLAGISGFSWVVWAHHFYHAGLGPYEDVFYTTTTKIISVPTAMLLFNWIATMWGGKIRFTAPMMYAVGLIIMFMIGGFTGLVNSSSAGDRQVQNTYWIVGHFHYTLIGGVVFGFLATLIYWWPKMTGRMMSDRLGKWSFWFVFVGFNLTFFPQLVAGLLGEPRRIYTYLAYQGWDTVMLLSTIGALTLAVGVAILYVAAVVSLVAGPRAPADPWDGHGLEWGIPSPVPVYNFAKLPFVRDREALWHEKLHGNGRLLDAPDSDDPDRHGNEIHMPSPSVMPLLVGLGCLIGGFGVTLHNGAVAIIGAAVLVAAVLGWILEDDSGYRLVVKGGESA